MRRGWRTFFPWDTAGVGKWFYDSDNQECQRSLKATDTYPNAGFWKRLRIPSKLIRGTCFPLPMFKVKEFCLPVFSHLIAHPRTTSPSVRSMDLGEIFEAVCSAELPPICSLTCGHFPGYPTDSFHLPPQLITIFVPVVPCACNVLHLHCFLSDHY